MGNGANMASIAQTMAGLLRMAAQQMQTNTPQAIANLTGGEYVLFDNPKGLDEALGLLANHAHNRYQLSFRPKKPVPGPHKIDVYVRNAGGASISARAGYWLTAPAVSNEAQPVEGKK
jgi:hypothetical protein